MATPRVSWVWYIAAVTILAAIANAVAFGRGAVLRRVDQIVPVLNSMSL